MRPQLLMFDETPKWDDLAVRVVVEVDGEQVEGRATGNVTTETRLQIVARASLDAAERVHGEDLGRIVGVTTGEVEGCAYVLVILAAAGSADHAVGAAPLRHFEDRAQVAIRAVFDAVNRRLSGI
jgi:hypothetical protein